MSKLTKALKAISWIIRKPVLLNRVLHEPDIWRQYVQEKYDLNPGLPVVDPSLLFGDDYAEDLKVFTFLDGGSLVTDLALLKGLARKFKKCRYFEIGTWRGESAINVAEVADEVFTLNFTDDELRSIGVNERSISQQGLFSGKNPKITHLRSNSLDFDFASPGGKFDLVFIDGSHHYEDVKHDTVQVFKHMVNEQSFVVWHDYGNTPEVIRYEVFAAILDGTPEKIHKDLYHVAHTKSAIYYPEILKSTRLEYPVDPSFYYRVDIKQQRIEKK